MTQARRGAELLVECLLKHGVEYIWGIPGAKIDAIFDALLDSPIKLILCRHEQNAAFIASAYGRITGKPGVVLVTSGPGISNLATGLLTATTEGDPVIAIGAGVSRAMKLKQSHQSADNLKLMEAVTKSRTEILMVENIPEVIDNAFRSAVAPRSGAVFLSIPQDVTLEHTSLTAFDIAPPMLHGPAPALYIEEAATLIKQANNPVLFLGLEASRPENAAQIRELLSKTKLPTIGTYQAAGVVSRDLEECFVGRVGLFKNQPGDVLLDGADLIITVGYDPVEYDPEIWNTKQHKNIIHIDYNPADIHAAYIPRMELIGQIASTLHELGRLIPVEKSKQHLPPLVTSLRQELLAKIAQGKTKSGELIHPLRFIHDLQQTIDDSVTVVSDIGTHHMWLARYFFSYNPHHLLFSNGQQTLGVGLPWAMAACYARPGTKVISISGDGGFLFSAMELETAVREKLHFVHFVWCDGSYNMVEEQQLLKYGRSSAVHFGAVDIVKYAESFGAHGFLIRHSDELIPLLHKAMALEGPVLVQVNMDYSDNPQLFETLHPGLMH